MSDTAYVDVRPDCDICTHEEDRSTPAEYDARLRIGAWAYVCPEHWRERTTQRLGTGFGQRLVVGEKPQRSDAQIRADILTAIDGGDWDAAEDALGDRDIAEFL